jgi:hypothetical protein
MKLSESTMRNDDSASSTGIPVFHAASSLVENNKKFTKRIAVSRTMLVFDACW